MLAHSESTNSQEVGFLLNYLKGQGWIEANPISRENEYTITVEGYTHLNDLEKVVTDSSQGFIAMWFDRSTDDLWERGIEPAIEAAGYKLIRIDRIDFLDKTDDMIIAQIRRSRFVVVDFTHQDYEEGQSTEEIKRAGVRGSVYFEAGFAYGLNIPMIFTCRSDMIDKVHFDTRQYPHILWKPGELEEFRTTLTNRIFRTIGDGPLRGAQSNGIQG